MSRMEKPWTITGDPAAKRGAYTDGLSSANLPKAFKTLAQVADQFAALEAARLTSSAEPDALTPVVMSGGAEPAGAAKPFMPGRCRTAVATAVKARRTAGHLD